MQIFPIGHHDQTPSTTTAYHKFENIYSPFPLFKGQRVNKIKFGFFFKKVFFFAIRHCANCCCCVCSLNVNRQQRSEAGGSSASSLLVEQQHRTQEDTCAVDTAQRNYYHYYVVVVDVVVAIPPRRRPRAASIFFLYLFFLSKFHLFLFVLVFKLLRTQYLPLGDRGIAWGLMKMVVRKCATKSSRSRKCLSSSSSFI